MGLYQCPDCDNGVSPSAMSCPQCGRPMLGAKIAVSSRYWGPLQIFAIALCFGPVLGIEVFGMNSAAIVFTAMSIPLMVISLIGAAVHRSIIRRRERDALLCGGPPRRLPSREMTPDQSSDSCRSRMSVSCRGDRPG